MIFSDLGSDIIICVDTGCAFAANKSFKLCLAAILPNKYKSSIIDVMISTVCTKFLFPLIKFASSDPRFTFLVNTCFKLYVVLYYRNLHCIICSLGFCFLIGKVCILFFL